MGLCIQSYIIAYSKVAKTTSTQFAAYLVFQHAQKKNKKT